MATPTTNFPLGREQAAFEAVAAILRAAPALVNQSVKFRSWDGSKPDGQEVSSNQGPTARLSPKVGPSQIVTRRINTVKFVVSIELFASGMIASDIANFWTAVRLALARDAPYLGTSVEKYLQSRVNCYRYTVDLPGYGAWEREPPTDGLAGEGRITLDLQVAA